MKIHTICFNIMLRVYKKCVIWGAGDFAIVLMTFISGLGEGCQCF